VEELSGAATEQD